MYKNKARIKSPAFHPKRGGGGLYFFIYLFYSPLRNAPCTAGAISAALIRSPATSLCLAKISVGTRILTLMATMAANYKSALRYLVLIGKMLHESEYAWGHTCQVPLTVAQLARREQTVLSSRGDRKSGHYSRASVFFFFFSYLNGGFILNNAPVNPFLSIVVISGGKSGRKLNRRYVGSHVSSVSKVYK